jgi:hypothetical protein
MASSASSSSIRLQLPRRGHSDQRRVSPQEFAALLANSHRNKVRFLRGVCGVEGSREDDPVPFSRIYPAHPCPLYRKPSRFSSQAGFDPSRFFGHRFLYERLRLGGSDDQSQPIELRSTCGSRRSTRPPPTRNGSFGKLPPAWAARLLSSIVITA